MYALFEPKNNTTKTQAKYFIYIKNKENCQWEKLYPALLATKLISRTVCNEMPVSSQ